jgi:hypothetical protein
MAQCKATCVDGTPCPKAAMVGSDLCWNHSRDPVTGKFPQPLPIDRERTIRILETQLRGVYRQKASIARATTIMKLVEMIERLRGPAPEEKDEDVRTLTVEERLARRG